MKIKDLKFKHWLFGICLAIVAYNFVNGYIQESSKKEAQQATMATTVTEVTNGYIKNGEEGYLKADILGGLTKDDLDELVDAANIKDNDVFSQKVGNGTAFFLRQGLKVKLLDNGVLSAKIRVMEGEKRGIACYIPSDYLLRDQK